MGDRGHRQFMEHLRQVLAQGDTVLFIGSGISLWSGLPSWPRLIEELAKFVEAAGEVADLVRAEAQSGDLLQAAGYGFDKLTKQQIGDFIRAACRYGAARPHEIHRKIVSLGPRCFVTTNYDNLIEESLRSWQPDRFYRPPVTNRHLTETAEIVHARAIDFIFKPHGDAADSDSIILTREQYRQLLPGGERQAALESLKMLLASRPVIYLGFGLRDPDFLYVRDLLANTYKGGTRDHYAIMADTSQAEADYWRRSYGIHLVPYTTSERPDNSRDHSTLLVLLEELVNAAPPVPTVTPPLVGREPFTPEAILALARHAARLTRTSKSNPEFPLRVHLARLDRSHDISYYARDKFDHYPVERFLDDGPEHALLIGLPGAGKTYSMRQSAARLAQRLHDACLADPFDEKGIVVPILADLKLYGGDLHALVDRSLPSSLALDVLVQRFKVKIFLDAFNEMPRDYWDSAAYESDLIKFLGAIGKASVIVGSRTSDGLGKLSFPCYYLDEIDETFAATELRRLNIAVGGRFEQELLALLRKPFYFNLIADRAVSLPSEAHPRDLFESFFGGLRQSFASRFGQPFDLERALSLAAYEAIDRGEQAQPLADLLQVLTTQLQGAGFAEVHDRDVVNWLVAKAVIIPYTGGRVALFHQSATEYLAAKELARQYQANPRVIKEKLSLTRWDEALFLTLSLLPPDKASSFLQAVIEADFALALKAAKYLEVGRDRVVAELLSEIPRRVDEFHSFEGGVEFALEFGLPIMEVHEPALRAVMKCGGAIGAAAVSRLVEMRGAAVKDELLQALVDCRDDYNYCCNGIAPALAPFVTAADVGRIVELADSLRDEVTPEADEEMDGGFVNAIGPLLIRIEIGAIKDAFLPKLTAAPVTEIRARILTRLLWDRHSTEALEFAGDLLLRGIRDAATAIYFIVTFKEDDEISWISFNGSHVECLLSMTLDIDNKTSGLDALGCLCKGRPDLAGMIEEQAMNSSCLFRAVLLYCVSPSDGGPVMEALNELVAMSPEQRLSQPIHLLERIPISWKGHENLLVQLLKLRDAELALGLVGQAYLGSNFELGELEIGPIEWWLEWLMDEESSIQQKERYFLKDRISFLLARWSSKESRAEFVAEFNKSESRFRRVLGRSILLARDDLTTDDFSEYAISFLLADLKKEGSIDYIRGHLLGRTATESFVSERLLPLLPETTGRFRKNLSRVLLQAGSRHGRRYVTSGQRIRGGRRRYKSSA